MTISSRPRGAEKVPRHPRRKEQGFTLLELLVTMAILALLAGIGAGVFTNLRFEARGTAGIVKTIVRATREEAVRSGLPARVDFAVDERTVRGVFFQVIGSWQFETAGREFQPRAARSKQAPDPLEGGFFGFDSGAGLAWTTRGPVQFQERGGYPGGYLALGNKGVAELQLGGSQTFLTDRGFAVQFAARLGEDYSGTLATRPEAFTLSLSQGGRLQALIQLAEPDGATGVLRGAGQIALRTAPRVLLPGRFARIALLFDGRLAQLLVDGREEARHERDGEAYVRVFADSRLAFGGGGTLDLDDVRVHGSAEQGPIDLPPDAALVLQGQTGSRTLQRMSVFFTADGFLDPRRHPAPLTFAIEVASTREDQVASVDVYRIGLLGTVQDPGEPEPPQEPVEKK